MCVRSNESIFSYSVRTGETAGLPCICWKMYTNVIRLSAPYLKLLIVSASPSAQVYASLAAVAAWVLVGLPAITYFTGFEGLIKFWLMPWVGYHFWMSTFTVIHHTAPHIPFKMPNE